MTVLDAAKFSLTEDEVLTLAKWGVEIEKHYQHPQDIEWAKDGKTGKLFIVQSRPETVTSERVAGFYEEYIVKADLTVDGIADRVKEMLNRK